MKYRARVCGLILGLLVPLSAKAQVTLTDNGTTVTLANGIVTATIQKSNGQITSMKLGSLETVSGNIYYSMDGGTTYQQPGPCVYSITAQSANLVDVDFFQVYTNQIHPVDIDLHYVMLAGVSGVYTYAILNHPASYPALGIAEWRTVWKHPNNGTTYTFENLYVDNQPYRHGQGPSYSDILNASATGIAEVVYLNTGVWVGTYFTKYQFNDEYYKIGTWGHASTVNSAGAWVIPGSFEFFNDGPTKQDLTIAEDYVLVHYGMNHYDGSTTSMAAGESWSKIYGPNLLYLNSCPTGADACWTDAQSRVNTEHAAWPYTWLNNSLYPQASGRGTITGKFIVNDPIKTTLTGANAWVGVAQPDAGGNWQYESKRYEYWVKADSQGNFTISNVRPGTYMLSAFVTGAVGEYTQTNVMVSAGATTALGNVTWNVTHSGNSIAWEIGVPDRSAAEFRNGDSYYMAFGYNNIPSQFPNPLNYTVGTSNWATDWNYVQTAHDAGGAGTTIWPWNINFNLASVPTSGNATLTLAWAGTGYAAENVYVNDPNMLNPPLTQFYPVVGGGNALIREGVHAKYGVNYVTIPVSLLKVGANTITLYKRATGSTTGATSYVMYDYLNLEMPTAASPDLSISGSPSSQTVTAGAGTSYTATVTAVNGFTGTVNFSVSGLPSGASGSFNPTSVAGSGSSALSVSTSSTTPAGTYTLTITGTSGSLTHSTTVTLVVNAAGGGGDFSIAATPSSRTLTVPPEPNSTTYSITVTPSGGFTGTVTFSVSGLPTGTTASFSPSSVAGSGSSTLTVTGDCNANGGTFTLTISGTSGSLSHSTTVTLVLDTGNC